MRRRPSATTAHRALPVYEWPALGMPWTGHLHTGRALCAVVAERLLHIWKTSSIQQNRTPHKPPAQPRHSTQCRLHHTRCPLKRLHLVLQCPMAYPGLTTHTLAGLSALWLPRGA